MSRSQSLGDSVKAKLRAAVEEMFSLFDKTIAEYEAELGRSREENQRKQRLLDSLLFPMIPLETVRVPGPPCPESFVTQAGTQTSQMSDVPQKPDVKVEEMLSLHESTVFVQRKEPPPSQRRQTGRRKSRSATSLDTDWTCPLSAEESSETKGGKRRSVRRNKSTMVNGGAMLDTNTAPEPKRRKRRAKTEHLAGGVLQQDPVCKSEVHLQSNSPVHSETTPPSCSICGKTFRNSAILNAHMATHTNDHKFSCPVCNKTFLNKYGLISHDRLHTDVRPYSCSVCGDSFRHSFSLHLHIRTHTGEEGYRCRNCKRTFSQKGNLHKHYNRTHRRITVN